MKKEGKDSSGKKSMTSSGGSQWCRGSGGDSDVGSRRLVKAKWGGSWAIQLGKGKGLCCGGRQVFLRGNTEGGEIYLLFSSRGKEEGGGMLENRKVKNK